MKTVILSDTHFGAWAGNDLLRHEFALDVLRPRLRAADRLVLLGDTFELCFQTLEKSFTASLPFFQMIKEEMQGGELVFVSGNHDHHLVVRNLEDIVEAKLASGEGMHEAYVEAQQHSFLDRFLRRTLEGVEITTAYPTYVIGDILCTHGHYMDIHIKGSISHRLQQMTTKKITGHDPDSQLSYMDYEAMSTPLYELYYQVAQLPKGIAAQSAIWTQLGRIAHLIQLTGNVGRETGKAVK